MADLGGPEWTMKLVSSSSDQLIPRPQVWATGPLLSNYLPPAFAELKEPLIIQLTTPAQARAAVDRLAEQGTHFIKLWMIKMRNFNQVLPSFQAEIRRAHEKNLRVFAHATELETAKIAVAAGIDVLAHAIGDKIMDDHFIEIIKKIITISTLAVDEGYKSVLSKTAVVSNFQRKCGDPEVMKTWNEIPTHLIRN